MFINIHRYVSNFLQIYVYIIKIFLEKLYTKTCVRHDHLFRITFPFFSSKFKVNSQQKRRGKGQNLKKKNFYFLLQGIYLTIVFIFYLRKSFLIW